MFYICLFSLLLLLSCVLDCVQFALVVASRFSSSSDGLFCMLVLKPDLLLHQFLFKFQPLACSGIVPRNLSTRPAYPFTFIFHSLLPFLLLRQTALF